MTQRLKTIFISLTGALLVGVMSFAAQAQSQKRGDATPTVEEAMDFIVSQIELDHRVKSVRREGATRVVVTRVNGTVAVDFSMLDERYTSGTDALFNCAKKDCVAYLSADGASVLRNANQVTFAMSSSERAQRVIRAAGIVFMQTGRKTPF